MSFARGDLEVLMAKPDIESAYRQILKHLVERHLLSMC